MTVPTISAFVNLDHCGWIEMMFFAESRKIMNFNDFANWGTKPIQTRVIFPPNFGFFGKGFFGFRSPTRTAFFHKLSMPFRRPLLTGFFGLCNSLFYGLHGHDQTCMIYGIWATIVKFKTICLEFVNPILFALNIVHIGIFKGNESKSIFTKFIPGFLKKGIGIDPLTPKKKSVLSKPRRDALLGTAHISGICHDIQNHVNTGFVLVHWNSHPFLSNDTINL